jgi:hypothetical protein
METQIKIIAEIGSSTEKYDMVSKPEDSLGSGFIFCDPGNGAGVARGLNGEESCRLDH